MRICFVVADIQQQQPTFSGIYLALSAHRRGHDVRFVSVDDLSFLDDNNVLATTARVRAGDYATTAAYAHALSSDEAVIEEDTLGSFDVVFLRYNPIREGEARPGAPLIDFGWRLRLAGTLVVNDPEGLRRARQPHVPG
jgi:glutathione synthase